MALIGWWQFENNINDSSMYEWSSSLSGSSISYTKGPIGKSVFVSSTPTKIITEVNKNLFMFTDLSISFFIKLSGSHANYNNTIVSAGNFYLYHNAIISTWTLEANYLSNIFSSVTISTSSINIPNDVWTHVCLTRTVYRNVGFINIYINGKLYGSAQGSNNFFSWYNLASNEFTIFAKSRNDTTYNGAFIWLSDLKLFNHLLSDKEIEELSKGKIFHVNFEDTCDSIADRFLTASVAANTGFLHTSTGSLNSNSNKIGESVFEINSVVNSINYGNSSLIQFDKSASGHTFSFWINSTNYTSPSRQNIFSKAYGGEGSLVLEPTASGYYSFYWGTVGTDAGTYGVSFMDSTSSLIVTNSIWKHVSIVRDNINNKIYWYSNGNYIISKSYTASIQPTSGGQSFYLFDGHVNYLNGYVDDFRIYATTLSAAQIYEVYTSRAYLSHLGSYISKGSIRDTDFYYGFEGQVSDSRAFNISLGGGTANWGIQSGSRRAFRIINDNSAWDCNITTIKKFSRPSVFYGNVKMDYSASNTLPRLFIGWKDNTNGVSFDNYTYAFYIEGTNNPPKLNLFLSGSQIYGGAKYLSRSVWYEYKLELFETGAAYYWRTIGVEKNWSLLYEINQLTENNLRPALTHYDSFTNGYSWHDNWAVSTLKNEINSYGDIKSYYFDEIGRTEDLIYWPLNFTTASYVSGSGNIYPLTASFSEVRYTTAANSLNGAVILNYTQSSSPTLEFLTHPLITKSAPWWIMAWVFLSGSSNRYQGIIGLSGSNNFTLGINQDGKLFYSSSGNVYASSSGIVNSNEWNHIVVYAPGNISALGFIINGIAESAVNVSSQPILSSSCIGLATNSTSSIFKGIISDVRIYLPTIYQNNLTTQEVSRIYNLGIKNFGIQMYNLSSSKYKPSITSKNFGENY